MDKQNRTRDIVFIGMFAAVLGVGAQLSIPMPSGVPVTLQMFLVALTGCVLGWKNGAAAACIYIAIGIAGVPVFTQMRSGLSVIIGPTGGFLIGYPFMVMLCGLGSRQRQKWLDLFLCQMGLAVCYLFGTVQFSLLGGMSLIEAFLLVGLPYLPKDVLFVGAASIVGRMLVSRLRAAGLVKIL